MSIRTAIVLGVISTLASSALAQSATSPPTLGVPDGFANYTGSVWVPQSLPCKDGCLLPVGVYRTCLTTVTVPISGEEIAVDQGVCNDWLCDNDFYDQLLACLNCIIANGNERPPDYDATSSSSSGDGLRFDPADGYLNETHANEWLANVVERCSSIDQNLDDVTTTVTATPTTTGPYGTTFTIGQSVGFETWTGLTEYSDQFSATSVLPWEAALASGTGSPGASGSSASGSTASPSASPSTTPNAGTSVSTKGSYAWCLGLTGLLLL